MKYLLSLVALLAGCTGSITRVGPDMFVSQTTYGEVGAIEEANEFCGKQRLAAVITSITPSTERAYARVFFRCLNPNSAEYRQQRGGPTYNPVPSVIIQDNRQR